MLISLLSSLLPYLLGAIAVIGGYFFIKRKGVQEERQRQMEAKAEAIQKVTEKVTEAVREDATIDANVRKSIEELKETLGGSKPSSPDKFRF